MAHQSLKLLTRVSSILALTIGACGGTQPAPPLPLATSATASPSASATAASFPEEKKLLHFHSKRFGVQLPLPDGKGWKINDHSQPELVATHAATTSKITLTVFADPELMNRQKCEDKSREKKLVSATEMRVVEQQIVTGPEAYDTRVLIAIEPPAMPGKPIIGHVFAFGGFLRKCLFFHFQSEVPTANDEETLSARLAIARVRVLDAIAIDPFIEPPKEKPSVGR
jgi:hypothetical protein